MTINAAANAAKWDEAFNLGNTTGVGGFYAAEGLIVPAGGAPVTGPAAIGQFFNDLRSKGFDGHKIVVENVMDKGDTVVVTGKWQLNGPGDDGATKQYGGNWVNVLGRNGEILLHTWN